MSTLINILGGVSSILIYRVHGLLNSNNVVQRSAATNETALLSTDQVIKNTSSTISQDFSGNFIKDITQRNRPKIRNSLRALFLRD